jgi:three-Cys-motif partner protein
MGGWYMAVDTFFGKASEKSIVKTRIVYEYFGAWFNVLKSTPNQRLAYIDLYCGTGVFGNGVKSTPILILEQAVNDEDMRSRLVTLFNDDNEDHVRALQAAVTNIQGINGLRYQPKFWNKRVEGEVAEHFKTIDLVPTLLFADPWGYKGLSLDLIKCVLRNWGTDCIFFFNFNRVNMHLGQPLMDRNMNDLFGEQRADELRRQLDHIDNPPDRERAVIHAIAEELKTFGVRYAPYFMFTNDDGNKTSHHIILASKSPLADRMIRRIYAKWSSSTDGGIASFGFNPVEKRRASGPKQASLFDLLSDADPIDDLGEELLEEFASRCVNVVEIMAEYTPQHPGSKFTDSNFKAALIRLIDKGCVTLPEGTKRRPKTLADHITIIFPPIR